MRRVSGVVVEIGGRWGSVPQCCRNRINAQMAAGDFAASMRVLVAAMRRSWPRNQAPAFTVSFEMPSILQAASY